MARLPDLVRDSKLETRFLQTETVHKYDEVDPSSRRRVVSRSEHWERQKKIGRGGFGSVWLEKCTKGDRGIKVRAVKQIDVDRRFAIDYSRELEAVAKFSHWKASLSEFTYCSTRYTDAWQYERCFVKSFGWYESPDSLYIAMEYLDLGDLDTYLRRKSPLPEAEVKQVIGQILDGLCMMHDNQFAHRDLKPKNILLKSCPPNEWWVKIADFGISKRIEEDTNGSTTVKGTPGYIAPELYGFLKQGSPYAVDIWAVGEIVFRMLTKQPTFEHFGLLSKYTIRPETFPFDILLAAQSSPLAVEFILSHMRPHPEDRITAGNALLHQWITQPPLSRQVSVTSASHQDAQSSSTTESLTESFAAWDTITPQQAAPTTTTMRAEELKTSPHPISSKKTGNSQALDHKLVMLHNFRSGAQLLGVVFSPDGRLIASASADSTIQLWDPAKWPSFSLLRNRYPSPEPRHILRGHSGPVSGVTFSPDGKLVASASEDRTVRLWDLDTGKIHHILQHSSSVYGVAFSPDGQLIASASYDHELQLWVLATGVARYTFQGHSNLAGGVAFSPDGRLVASTSRNHTVRLWDPATGAIRHTLRGHSNSVNGVAFSPDGRLVASASSDSTVRLWDPVTGVVRHIFQEHAGSVNGVAFSPDGRLVASASHDRKVRLWDPATGAVHHTLRGHSSSNGVAFSPDGKLLAAATGSKFVLWSRVPHN